MEAIAEEITERIRALIGDDPNIGEKKMFGGLCFLLNGNMLCGPTKQGDLMLRIGKDAEADALARPGARPMDFTGRPMRGFVFVEPGALKDDKVLAEWLALATAFVATLPAK